MKNIITQDGCWNCLFSFLEAPYDDPYTWYCDHTRDRPRCGECDNKTHEECSVHDEKGKKLPDEEIIRRMDAWTNWIKGKEVKPGRNVTIMRGEKMVKIEVILDKFASPLSPEEFVRDHYLTEMANADVVYLSVKQGDWKKYKGKKVTPKPIRGIWHP